MVKETICQREVEQPCVVSIPSRGSGKGDKDRVRGGAGKDFVSIPSRGSGKGDQSADIFISKQGQLLFQSPLGEVVKET